MSWWVVAAAWCIAMFNTFNSPDKDGRRVQHAAPWAKRFALEQTVFLTGGGGDGGGVVVDVVGWWLLLVVMVGSAAAAVAMGAVAAAVVAAVLLLLVVVVEACGMHARWHARAL